MRSGSGLVSAAIAQGVEAANTSKLVLPPGVGSYLTAESFPYLQGTNSSKKKKAAKVKRAMQAVKKAERRQAGSVSESFAAMQLLHDPQVRCKTRQKAPHRVSNGTRQLCMHVSQPLLTHYTMSPIACSTWHADWVQEPRSGPRSLCIA
jgi:hypothetical protein